MAQLTIEEIRKTLRKIADNKRTKDRDKIKALQQLADIAVESLELIPNLERIHRIVKLNFIKLFVYLQKIELPNL
jgi:hypothetical protein